MTDVVIVEVDGHKVAAPIDSDGYVNHEDWRIAS